MSSLAPGAALYHAQAKIFSRTDGRSAVAAAAYRSASCLHDDRIGQTFDYSKKSKVAAFIIASAGAPAWAHNRQELWNRVERAERYKTAQVAREWEISIPRDIPQGKWEDFAREVAAPFVQAGAIVDVAIHCPRAADGGIQPHIHMMITPRAIDESTPTGFAKKKNDAIERMHASGGRYGGGDRGDALKIQRERIAGIMNQNLEDAGSPRRVSHLSRVARGLEDDPEPTMGEGRKAAVAKRGEHDSLTGVVSRIRKTRNLENELIQIEEEIMALSPKHQVDTGDGGIRPRRQQDFKKQLLSRRFPDAMANISAGQLHMIDTKQNGLTRIQTRDGGWIEVDHAGRVIKTYGAQGQADQIAQAIYAADYADHIERLEELRAAGRKGGIRPRKPGDRTPGQDMTQVESHADRWRSRGFTHVTEATDGTWVHIGNCKLQDLGNEVRIHGKPTDATCHAMLQKAWDEWGAETEVFGSREFKDMMWLHGQRMGVAVYDQSTGELYEPSPDIRKAYEADRQKVEDSTADLETARDQRDIAELLKTAATGDMKAIAELENSGEVGLAHFVVFHLDKKQREAFTALSPAEVAEGLSEYRKAGTAARERWEAEGASEAKAGIKLETVRHDDDDENDPVHEIDAKRDEARRLEY